MGIEDIAGLDESAEFDGKNIWVAVDGEKNWDKKLGGCGFIYRNFIGAAGTKQEVTKQVYRKLNFLGMEVVVGKNEKDFSELIAKDENYKIRIFKYDLSGPSIFDVNH